MKMSRHDRKIYNQGKQAGYNDGYIQGLHDGNPFNAIADALTEFGRKAGEILSDPDIKQALIEAQQANDNTLIIEGEDNEDL